MANKRLKRAPDSRTFSEVGQSGTGRPILKHRTKGFYAVQIWNGDTWFTARTLAEAQVIGSPAKV